MSTGYPSLPSIHLANKSTGQVYWLFKSTVYPCLLANKSTGQVYWLSKSTVYPSGQQVYRPSLLAVQVHRLNKVYRPTSLLAVQIYRLKSLQANRLLAKSTGCPSLLAIHVYWLSKSTDQQVYPVVQVLPVIRPPLKVYCPTNLPVIQVYWLIVYRLTKSTGYTSLLPKSTACLLR